MRNYEELKRTYKEIIKNENEFDQKKELKKFKNSLTEKELNFLIDEIFNKENKDDKNELNYINFYLVEETRKSYIKEILIRLFLFFLPIIIFLSPEKVSFRNVLEGLILGLVLAMSIKLISIIKSSTGLGPISSSIVAYILIIVILMISNKVNIAVFSIIILIFSGLFIWDTIKKIKYIITYKKIAS